MAALGETDCRWCNAKILWAQLRSGRRVPVELHQVREGHRYALHKGPDGLIATVEKMEPGHPNHFPNCELDMTRAAKRYRERQEAKKQEDLF